MAITYSTFESVDIRAGTILRAEPFPEARKPSLKLWIDFGELGVKASSAQITEHYTPEGLIGTQIMAVVNFEPKRIAGFVSEVLTLGLTDDKGYVVLARPDQSVPNGSRLF